MRHFHHPPRRHLVLNPMRYIRLPPPARVICISFDSPSMHIASTHVLFSSWYYNHSILCAVSTTRPVTSYSRFNLPLIDYTAFYTLGIFHGCGYVTLEVEDLHDLDPNVQISHLRPMFQSYIS